MFAVRSADQIAKVTVFFALNEALVLHPEIVVELRQIAIAGIAGKGHDPLFLGLLPAVLERRSEQCPRRRTGEYALDAQQVARGREGLGVADRIGPCHAREIGDRRNEVFANAFDEPAAAFVAEFAGIDVLSKYRADRICKNDFDIGRMLIEVLANPGDRAT